MNEQEITAIMQLPNAAIVAPAGHGKTEMIVELVDHGDGKQLLLTHTNAGVDAITKRLKKQGVDKEKYAVSTIAAFCIRWCMSYSNSAQFDKCLSPLNGQTESKNYYAQLYSGAKQVFKMLWAGKVLQTSYAGVIVDEYQDCIQEQHEIFLEINNFLPIWVLGDPMQGIFSFAGKLVDWKNLEFQRVQVATRPWRWNSTNPALGAYLMDVRSQLLPILDGRKCSITIDSCNGSIEIINPQDFNGYKKLKEFQKYLSVVYIAKWPNKQLAFCSRMPGIFQNDEKQDCDELYKYARLFDESAGAQLLLNIIDFYSLCATQVGAELQSYRSRLKKGSFDFSRIAKHSDLASILSSTEKNASCDIVCQMLRWFTKQSVFKQYRSELASEMMRSASLAEERNISIFEAANHIRKDNSLQRRYTQFKYLSSRTLLSKGLEFDCVIIDMSDPLSAKDFYVAMTRAMRKIYILSPSDTFNFDV